MLIAVGTGQYVFLAFNAVMMAHLLFLVSVAWYDYLFSS